VSPNVAYSFIDIGRLSPIHELGDTFLQEVGHGIGKFLHNPFSLSGAYVRNQGMRFLAMGLLGSMIALCSSCGAQPISLSISPGSAPSGIPSVACLNYADGLAPSTVGNCLTLSTSVPATSAPSAQRMDSASCPGLSNLPTGSTQTITAQLTFYGAPDNSPPGSTQTSLTGDPNGGDGTYCNPTVFAAAYQNTTVPSGTRIYVPRLQKYFARQDDCSSPQYPNFCPGMWFDLWIGPANVQGAVDCENSITRNPEPVILYPPAGEPVPNSGPIYSNGICPNV
jgi:hypothetical protein